MNLKLKTLFSTITCVTALTACSGGSDSSAVELGAASAFPLFGFGIPVLPGFGTDNGTGNGTDNGQSIISGEIIEALPENLSVGENYPVNFKYTNTSAEEVTGIHIEYNFPENTTDVVSTCESMLMPEQSCEVSAAITSETPEELKLALTFSYDQGEAITLETIGLSTDVPITGEITETLTDIITTNIDYPVAFTFTNGSSSGSEATGVDSTVVVLNDAGDEISGVFTEESNNCKDTIAATESCEIAGIVNLGTIMPISVVATLSYNEGADVIETIEADSTDLLISPDVTYTSSEALMNIRIDLFSQGGLPNNHAELGIDPDYYRFYYLILPELQTDDNILSFLAEKETENNTGHASINVNLGGETIQVGFMAEDYSQCDTPRERPLNYAIYHCPEYPTPPVNTKFIITQAEWAKVPDGIHEITVVINSRIAGIEEIVQPYNSVVQKIIINKEAVIEE